MDDRFENFAVFTSVISGLNEHVNEFKNRLSYPSEVNEHTSKTFFYCSQLITPFGYDFNKCRTNKEIFHKCSYDKDLSGDSAFCTVSKKTISTQQCEQFGPIFDILTHTYPKLVIKNNKNDEKNVQNCNSLEYLTLSIRLPSYTTTSSRSKYLYNPYIHSPPPNNSDDQVVSGFYHDMYSTGRTHKPLSKMGMFQYLFNYGHDKVKDCEYDLPLLLPDWNLIEPIVKHSPYIRLPPPINTHPSDLFDVVNFEPCIIDNCIDIDQNDEKNEKMDKFTSLYGKSHYKPKTPIENHPHTFVLNNALTLQELPLYTLEPASLSTKAVVVMNVITIIDQTSTLSVNTFKDFLIQINQIQRSGDLNEFYKKKLRIFIVQNFCLDQFLLSENEIVDLVSKTCKFADISISYFIPSEIRFEFPDDLGDAIPVLRRNNSEPPLYCFNHRELDENNKTILEQLWEDFWPEYFLLLSQHYSNQKFAKQHYSKLSQLILFLKEKLSHKIKQILPYKNLTKTIIPSNLTTQHLLNHPICARALWELCIPPFRPIDCTTSPTTLSVESLLKIPTAFFPFWFGKTHLEIDQIQFLYFLRQQYRIYQPYPALDLDSINQDDVLLNALMPGVCIWKVSENKFELKYQNDNSNNLDYFSGPFSFNSLNSYGIYPPLDKMRQKCPVIPVTDPKNPYMYQEPVSIVRFYNIPDPKNMTIIQNNFAEFSDTIPNYDFLSQNSNHSTNSLSTPGPIRLEISSQTISQIPLLQSSYCPTILSHGPFFKQERPPIYLPDDYISLILSTIQFNAISEWAHLVDYLSPRARLAVFKHLSNQKALQDNHNEDQNGSSSTPNPVVVSKYGDEYCSSHLQPDSLTFGIDLSTTPVVDTMPIGQLPDTLFFNTSILIESRVLSTVLPTMSQVKDLFQFDPYKAFPEAICEVGGGFHGFGQPNGRDKDQQCGSSLTNADVEINESKTLQKYPKHYQIFPYRTIQAGNRIFLQLKQVDGILRNTFGKPCFGPSSKTNTGIPYSRYISPHRCETTVTVCKKDIYKVWGVVNTDDDPDHDSEGNCLGQDIVNNSKLIQTEHHMDHSQPNSNLSIRITHLVRNDAHFYTYFEPPELHFKALPLQPLLSSTLKVQAQAMECFRDAEYQSKAGVLAAMGLHGASMPLLFSARILPFVFNRLTDDLNYNNNVFYPLTSPLIGNITMPSYNMIDKNKDGKINIKLPPIYSNFDTNPQHYCADFFTPQSNPKIDPSEHLQFDPIPGRADQYITPLYNNIPLNPVYDSIQSESMKNNYNIFVGTPFSKAANHPELSLYDATVENQQHFVNKIPIAFIVLCMNPIVPDHHHHELRGAGGDVNDNSFTETHHYNGVDSSYISPFHPQPRQYNQMDGRIDHLTRSEFEFLRIKASFEYKQQAVDVLYQNTALTRDELKALITVYFISPQEWPQLFLKLQNEAVTIRIKQIGESIYDSI
jgi:hypothetical protein